MRARLILHLLVLATVLHCASSDDIIDSKQQTITAPIAVTSTADGSVKTLAKRGFFRGVGNFFKDTGKGIWKMTKNAVTDPIGFQKKIWGLVGHLPQTVKHGVDTMKAGCKAGKGDCIGKLVAAAGTFALTAGVGTAAAAMGASAGTVAAVSAAGSAAGAVKTAGDVNTFADDVEKSRKKKPKLAPYKARMAREARLRRKARRAEEARREAERKRKVRREEQDDEYYSALEEGRHYDRQKDKKMKKDIEDEEYLSSLEEGRYFDRKNSRPHVKWDQDGPEADQLEGNRDADVDSLDDVKNNGAEMNDSLDEVEPLLAKEINQGEQRAAKRRLDELVEPIADYGMDDIYARQRDENLNGKGDTVIPYNNPYGKFYASHRPPRGVYNSALLQRPQ